MRNPTKAIAISRPLSPLFVVAEFMYGDARRTKFSLYFSYFCLGLAVALAFIDTQNATAACSSGL